VLTENYPLPFIYLNFSLEMLGHEIDCFCWKGAKHIFLFVHAKFLELNRGTLR
jgi:hypothetical protein